MEDDKDAIIPSYKLHGPFDGHGISEVVESKNARLPVGTLVTYQHTRWEERSVVPAAVAENLVVLPDGARNSKIPLSSYVGVLGMPVSRPLVVAMLDCHIVRRDGNLTMLHASVK